MQKYDNSTRKQELEKLNAGYQKIRTLTFVLIGLLVLALLTAILKQMIPSIAALFVMLLFRFSIHKKARKEYQQALVDAALTCSIGSKLDQYELQNKGGTGITREEIREAELLPIREGETSFIGLYQGISGTLRGMPVSLNDTTLQQFQHAGQKGADVLCGVWMHFVLHQTTGKNYRVLTKDMIAADLEEEFFSSLPDLKKQDAAAAGLKEKVNLYGGGITPADASAANELFRKSSAQPALSVRGNIVDLFLKGRVLAPNYPISLKPDEKALNMDPLPEFRDVLALVKAL